MTEPCTYCGGWGTLQNLWHDEFTSPIPCELCHGTGFQYSDDDVIWDETLDDDWPTSEWDSIDNE
jgi:hypothetical protein